MLGLTLTLGARAGARVSELYGRVLLGLASRIGVHPQREIQCINAVKGGDFRTSDSIRICRHYAGWGGVSQHFVEGFYDAKTMPKNLGPKSCQKPIL